MSDGVWSLDFSRFIAFSQIYRGFIAALSGEYWARHTGTKPAIFFCPHASAGFGNDSTHYPNPRRRQHDRAVTGFWLGSLHDGKRGTGQISQGGASLYAPKLLERQCDRARAFATTPTRRGHRAARTTDTRGRPRNR